MRTRHLALACALAVLGPCVATRKLARPTPPPPRAPVYRLADHLREARRIAQHTEQIEPEALHLQPGSLKAPEGFRELPPQTGGAHPEVAHFVSDQLRPFRARIDVPVDGGRDYVIRALLRDPSGQARFLVEHAPAPEQPEPGWHKATEERGPDGRVRLDWREDVPPGRTTQTLLIECDAARDLVVESLTVREAGARDPNVIESGPAVALHGLVDRPVEGVRTMSPRGARRLLPSLLAADEGVYEWPLEGPPQERLEVETATVPHGAAGGAPIEMRVEVERDGRWSTLWQEVRGERGDAGGWRAARIALPKDARALRLATRATEKGRPQVVAWGNPTLRSTAAGPKRPHVLLITLDAVRPDHLSMYGYARPTSPFLDALSQRGARFTDVTAQRGHTWASTSSLITGLYPETSGVVARGARPHRGTRGIVDAFADAGYTTGRIGSPDLPRGQISGFDFAELGDFETDILDRLVALSVENEDRPLFLWVHLANAHYPWRVADAFNRFDLGYRGKYASGLTREEYRAEENAGISDEDKRHFTALYDGAILQMDTRLKEAMARLDQRGFFSNAIVAVTADHGAHFGEHGVWFMHSTPWHASLKVPLVLVAPGRVPAGVVVPPEAGRALLVDLGPTLLDLAGLPVDDDAGYEGISLRPAFGGGRLPARTTVTHFQPASYVLVENDRYELFYNPGGEPLTWPGELRLSLPLPKLGLYDRLRDPQERHDLSSEEPLIVGALQAEADAQAGAQAPKLSTEARQLLMQAGYADESE